MNPLIIEVSCLILAFNQEFCSLFNRSLKHHIIRISLVSSVFLIHGKGLIYYFSYSLATVAYTIGMADSNPSGNGTLTEDTTTDSEEGTRRPANNSVQTRSASHPSGQPETDANASASAGDYYYLARVPKLFYYGQSWQMLEKISWALTLIISFHFPLPIISKFVAVVLYSFAAVNVNSCYILLSACLLFL